MKNYINKTIKFFREFFEKFYERLCFLTSLSSHVIVHFIKNLLNRWYYSLEEKSFLLELRSLSFAFFFAFLFYYFIIIELSILIFGYSLLCYRIFFIFLFLGLIISWRLEIYYLKYILTPEERYKISPDWWTDYYRGESPYTLYNYLTDYEDKALFWYLLVDKNWDHINESRLFLSTFYILFSFAFFYFCTYRFWPKYIKFVSNYFQPLVNFFEIRAQPRLIDGYTSLIRFWDWLLTHFEYKYRNDPDLYDLYHNMSGIPLRMEEKSNWIWFNKISLKKTSFYGDIYFLWSLRWNKVLSKLIFDIEQPTEVADWFDPNISLFFLRYMWGEFGSSRTNNYWKKYFTDDPHMWKFIKWQKKFVDDKFDEIDQWGPALFFDDNIIIPSPHDVLMSENYFDNKLNLTKKNFLDYGAYREVPDNLTQPQHKIITEDFALLEQAFTREKLIWEPQTISYLLKNFPVKYHIRKYKKDFDWSKWNIYETYDFQWKRNLTFENLKNMTMHPMIDYSYYKYSDKILFRKSSWFNQSIMRIQDINADSFYQYIRGWDLRLTLLEEKFELTPHSFSDVDYFWMNWKHLELLIKRRLKRIDTLYNNRGYYRLLTNQIPSLFELDFFTRYSVRLFSQIWNLIDKITFHKHVPSFPFIPADISTVDEFCKIESILYNFERKAGFWDDIDLELSWVRSNKNFSFWGKPWYIWNLKHFNTTEIVTPFPGFEWFYYPVPYPTPFSTFGFSWFWYQTSIVEKNSINSSITESVSYIEDWSSTPILTYTGVEAIMYFKYFFKIFDYIADTFIWAITYPVEFVTTQLSFIFNYISVLAFLVHITWFLHFYIYLFMFLYCFYYFLVYYYYQSSYMWIYERMFETGFVSQSNNLMYWHTLNDIWMNYKDPHQFSILTLHTNLLLSYSFNNLLKFTVSTPYGFSNFLNYISFFYSESSAIVDYFKYNNDKFLFYNNLSLLDNFKYYKYFYNLNYKKYTFLLYEGGSDCNLETLIWNYYDYLAQTSNYISKALYRNFFFKKINLYIKSLFKQITILFSTHSLNSNFFFLSMPLLDSSISRKLMMEIFKTLKIELYTNKENFINNFIFNIKNSENIFIYSKFLLMWFNYFNYFSKNIEDLYKIFDSKELNFISKFEKNLIWDSPEYWVFAFFWSFWFIKKTQYPNLNFHKVHEYNRLTLRRAAYANSWIGSTMNIWPSYNLIQHIWWTSWTYNPAFSITDNRTNLNMAGVKAFDGVWNFLEKRYYVSQHYKTESLFGFVTSLPFALGFSNFEKLRSAELSKLTEDITYNEDSSDMTSTNRLYDKTNPPIDLLDLKITPYILFKFFEKINPSFIFYYLTFLDQIDLIEGTLNEKILKWSASKDYPWYELVPDVFLKVDNQKELKTFDYYIKKFDYNLTLNKNNILSNWIFTFDTSFFFNHFLTWDYFNSEFKNSLLNSEIKKSNLFYLIKNQTFSEINSKYTTADHWLEKPFGVIDKLELNSIQRYKTIKDLDYLSYTNKKEDPFTFLEKETFRNVTGNASLNLFDLRNSKESYEERYIGEWFNWYAVNNSYIKNKPGLLLLGWVGELYTASQDSTSMLYSILYTSSETSPLSFQEKFKLTHFFDLVNYKQYYFDTYFDNKIERNKNYVQSFSWLNISLHPSSYWSFFGFKSIAKLDYWSWMCGLQIDYSNGFHNYRPYLGFWHSFGSKLTVFDETYGFYRSYWQIEDDPSMVDFETDALEYILESGDDMFKDFNAPKIDYKKLFDLNDEEDLKILDQISVLYREIYFSFHHPYFIGYFLFYFFKFLTDEFYLGLSNFSYKRLIAKNFYKNSFYNKNNSLYDFKVFSVYWNEIENWYRKNMYWYRLYFVNSIKLSNNFSNLLDHENSLTHTHEDHVTTTFYDLCSNLNYLENKNNLAIDLVSFLDYKYLNLQLLNINWYNLDMPFTLNPYLAINPSNKLSFNVDYQLIYNNYFLTFSHHDSLRENINFNYFYDSYLGTYLDFFNFSSYYSTYRSHSTLPLIALDTPNYLALESVEIKFDRSKRMADTSIRSIELYHNFDMIIGYGLVFQNIAFIRFFSTTLCFLLQFSMTYTEFFQLHWFLELYLKGFYFHSEFIQIKRGDISAEDWVYSPIIHPVNSMFSLYRHSYLLANLMKKINYDLMLIWFDLGYVSIERKQLKKVFWHKKLFLTNRFILLKKFYNWIGYQLFYFLFKK